MTKAELIKASNHQDPEIRSLARHILNHRASLATNELDEYEGSDQQLKDIDNHMLDIELQSYENHERILECKDCGTCMCSDQFEMVMLHNKIWLTICDDIDDVLCHRCIEHRLGRPIKAEDLGYSNTVWHEPEDDTDPIGCNIEFAKKHNLTY